MELLPSGADFGPSPARLVDVRPFEAGSPLDLPLYLSRVPAGFASPADDHVDRTLVSERSTPSWV